MKKLGLRTFAESTRMVLHPNGISQRFAPRSAADRTHEDEGHISVPYFKSSRGELGPIALKPSVWQAVAPYVSVPSSVRISLAAADLLKTLPKLRGFHPSLRFKELQSTASTHQLTKQPPRQPSVTGVDSKFPRLGAALADRQLSGSIAFPMSSGFMQVWCVFRPQPMLFS